MKQRRTFILALAASALAPLASFGKTMQEFYCKVNIGDGKDGRIWKRCEQPIKEHHVDLVKTKVRRLKGDANTYINLRFGKDGKAVENGRRVYLADDKEVVIVWKVNEAPRGRPIVINAYNGEVHVRWITTHDVK